MASLERTAYPRLGDRLSERELQHAYTLADEERDFIRRIAHGNSGRLTLAIMLKTRQCLGYFPSLDDVPLAIRRHLAKALGLPVSTALTEADHLKTSRSRYRLSIRAHLGSRLYADAGAEFITPVIIATAHIMSDPADLINVAVEKLIKANIELPAFSTLDRLVGHLRQKVHEELYAKITDHLTDDQRKILDGLLTVRDDETVTDFARLKETPGPASLGNVRRWADRLAELDALLDTEPFLESLPHTKIRQFAAEAKALSIGDIRGVMTARRRYTLLLCLLHRVQTFTRDELGDMFVRRLRRTRNSANDRLKAMQDKHRTIEENLIATFGQVLHHAKAEDGDEALGRQVRQVLNEQGGIEGLGAQVAAVSAYHNGNYFPLLWPVHAKHRAVLFRVLDLLQVEAATQDTAVLDALVVVREHRHARRDYLPADIDLNFASTRWRAFVTTKISGKAMLDRRALEVCVFTHVARGLESGDLYVVGSSAYADYRAQLLPWIECQDRVSDYCEAVGLPASGHDLITELKSQLTQLAAEVDVSFPENSELTIDPDGVPHLKRAKPTPLPNGFQAFEATVRQRMPERHLLDMLKHVHHWIPYTRHFGPPSGSEPKLKNVTKRYLFTIFGYGCNLGPSQTARHAPETINRHTMRRINAQHVNGNKLEAAVADVINEYGRFDLPRFWGSGTAAIADGTHIELRENNLLGETHIRYGGYGGIAYHHVADSYIALFCNFIACGVWEAVYILDGLLQNTSELKPDTLHADTHGQNEPVFGLAYLLGIKLFPRMRNWNDVIFYRPDKSASYRHIDALFGATVDWRLIEKHWRDMMQVILSIQAGKVLPSMLLRKLGSHNRTNTLYRAFRELGRIMRTLFLLRYISEAEFRQTIRAETTKIESFHSFMDWIGFGGPVIKSGDPVEQAKQLKYMDLVANTIMLHNVVDLTNVLAGMAADGYSVTKDNIARLSPYLREHIRRFGQYVLDMSRLPSPLEPKLLPIAA